jgi:hypothetical protein
MEDIWPLILENLGNMKRIIQLSLVNKLLLRIIKTHHWYFKFYIHNTELLEYVLNNYHFENLCLNSECDVNQYINKLMYCHTLDLSCTNVTDKSVKKLIHCHKIYLHGINVTQQCIQNLRDHGVIVM